MNHDIKELLTLAAKACDISEPVTDDVAAATRLAILRAAAEIGRRM
ncbi:MAG: hypothetical protein OEY28_06225 [Nitrospira sp.]|nr:hypothetical protein [Nitrospira sp.]